MTINPFEGGRRIAKLAAVLWILFSGWLAIKDWQQVVAHMETELQYLRFVGLIWIPIGLIALWSLTWIIGWIARGFLGVPRGQDHRPSAPDQ